MKLGIIRCMQTEDYCPGTTDFKAIREKTGAFEGTEEEIELIGFTNCGGCPGKKVPLRIRELLRRGADTIAFASCIQKGTPIGYSCPFAKRMKDLAEKEGAGDAGFPGPGRDAHWHSDKALSGPEISGVPAPLQYFHYQGQRD